MANSSWISVFEKCLCYHPFVVMVAYASTQTFIYIYIYSNIYISFILQLQSHWMVNKAEKKHFFLLSWLFCEVWPLLASYCYFNEIIWESQRGNHSAGAPNNSKTWQRAPHRWCNLIKCHKPLYSDIFLMSYIPQFHYIDCLSYVYADYSPISCPDILFTVLCPAQIL